MANQYTNPWTKEELAFLETNYSKLEKQQILRALPNRSWGSIVMKAHRMNLRRNSGRKINLLSEPEKAYLACAVDGEGTIQICKGKNPRTSKGWQLNTVVNISNTKLEFIEYIKTVTGLGRVRSYKPRSKKHKKCYTFSINIGKKYFNF